MSRYWFALVVGFAVSWPSVALSQDSDVVLVVPHSQKNPHLPHLVHSGGRVTLKAVLRNASCASYEVAWDVDRDGDFDDEQVRTVSRDAGGSVRDLGRTYEVPAVERDGSHNVDVRVRSLCDGSFHYGSYRMYARAFELAPDPRSWTPEQVEVARDMALKETMWYLHRTQVRPSGGIDRADFTSRPGNTRTTALAIWLLTINGHLPAYPPGTVDGFGRPLPDGWESANDARWHADPYAETVMRFTNYLVSGSAIQLGVTADDESNTCGYNPDGTERRCNRIAGTTDQRGAHVGSVNVYLQGMNLGALSTLLPALAGTPVQVGGVGIQGQSWEWFIQQVTDYLGAEQIDRGCAGGGWYYQAVDGTPSCNYHDASTSQWAFIGLESAEQAGGHYGVVVNNHHKYRISNGLVLNQRGDGGAGYRSASATSNFQLTGGSFVGARWLGMHQFAAGDDTVAFPGVDAFNANGTERAPYTRGELRQAYDRYLGFTSANWEARNLLGSVGWISGLWQEGDYLCGDTNGVYNQGRCGNTYAIYSHQKGYRTGTPELDSLGGHDWFRQFTIYYVRAQERPTPTADPLAGYANFGRINDGWCSRTSVTCKWGVDYLNTAMAGLVLTKTIFNAPPVAIARAVPPTTTEGCAGGNAGRVVFDHSESFHPNAMGRIVAHQWDFDDANGLWWETGAQADFQSPADDGSVSETAVHVYQRAGDYTATLRVIDHIGQVGVFTVPITVRPSANVPPSVVADGPFVIERGQPLELVCFASDGNLGCGDELEIGWDLDGDGQYDDAMGATPTVPWEELADLPEGAPNAIGVEVRDAAGESSRRQTTLTIYPPAPVARATANPNPAVPGHPVTFDASASFHPNPARHIAQVEWDVDGQPGFEGAGTTFRYSYDRFGDFEVLVRVTDDLGRAGEHRFQVSVSEGNRPPEARSARPRYEVLEGDSLVLDGGASGDPDAIYGDSIVRYEWDVNGDGDFGDGVDAIGEQAEVSWEVLRQIMRWPADPASGEPVNVVHLRVTDEFGAQDTVEVEVVIYATTPEVVIVQVLEPAPINLVTGFSNPSFDARESRSPIPGRALVRFDWDFDADGDIDVANQPVVEMPRVFQPVPTPETLPEVRVRLIVTDEDGRQASTERMVKYRVPPTPPHADADPSDPPERGYHALVGEPLQLDAGQSMDPDSEEFGDFIRFYRWDLDHDLDAGFQPDVVVEDANGDRQEARVTVQLGQLVQLGMDEPGRYPLVLEIEDTTGLVNEDSSFVVIHPKDPVARILVDPDDHLAPRERVLLDGRGSDHSHPDIDVVSYHWDLDGDGEFDDAEGAAVTHSFDQFSFDAPRQVSLQVVDSRGRTGVTTVEIAVDQGNRAPVADAGGYTAPDGRVIGPYVIAFGEPLRVSAGRSEDPDEGFGDAIVRYEWDVGDDGSYDLEGRDRELSIERLAGLGIDRVGEYRVRVRVTDRFGRTDEAFTVLRVVNGPAAVATADAERAGCARLVTFDGRHSSTDGPVGLGFALVRYEWDTDGDGVYDDGEGERVRLPVVGMPDGDGIIRQIVGLRVTDASGRTSTDTVEVRIDVDNLPPVADAGGPYATGPVGDGFARVVLDGRGCSDPNGPCDRVARYLWDTDGDGLFGSDDNPPDLEGAQVEYSNPAWRVGLVQTVGLVACDEFGECSAPAEAHIEVRDALLPTAEVVSPRADEAACVGAGELAITYRVARVGGGAVTATVFIGGVEVHEQVVETNPDGSPVEVNALVNPAIVPEGRHELVLMVRDADGGEAHADSGGRLVFDRTAPAIVISDGPRAGVCYGEDAVPEARIEVSDAYDAGPRVHSEVVAEGCQQTLRVTATDACGNEATEERGYLLARPPQLDVDGVEGGALVRSASPEWEPVGPEACAQEIRASIARDGGEAVDYAEGTPVVEPGRYALVISAADCRGLRREQVVDFTVNAPPVAVPVPARHPAADPDDPNGYLVREGEGLQLDGRDSRGPEDGDPIVRYLWDFDGDGVVDAEGELSAFPTDEDGVFEGTLTVEDSMGARSIVRFRVRVVDSDPVADPGGPYVVDEGSALELDGRGSAAGSASDPIVSYAWDFDGDGVADVAGPDRALVRHTFERDGLYLVSLTVMDEDSSHQALVRVEVRDVSPTIAAIIPPEDGAEILPVSFEVQASAGAESDPLGRIEWDVDGDGHVDYAGVGLRRIEHRYRDAGRYTVTVRVRDQDSAAVHAIEVPVREITLAELIGYVGQQAEIALGDEALSVAARFPLNGMDEIVARGLWGERHARRGNTLVALDRIVHRLVQAQGRGARFGLELWAIGRQLQRETARQYARVVALEDGPGEQHASVARGRDFMEQLEARFDGPDFESDAYSEARAGEVQALWADAYEAFYWFEDSVGPFRDGFRVPLGGGPTERANEAEPINQRLVEALAWVRADMDAYVAAGGDIDRGPGRAATARAIEALDEIIRLAGYTVYNPCPLGQRCVTDQEARDLLLQGIELADSLFAAANVGTYVRNWQNALVEMLAFRTELSLLRVDYVCGVRHPGYQAARAEQAIGLALADQNRDADALDFYADDARACMIVQVYNGCLVEELGPDVNVPAEYPEGCEPLAGELARQ